MNLTASNSFPISVYPTGLTQGFYYVVNTTTDTFQISTTSGGTPISSFSALGTLSKWHFEKYATDVLYVTGLTASKEYRVIFEGRFGVQGTLYCYPTEWQSIEWQITTVYGYPFIVANSGNVFNLIEAKFSNNVIGKMKYSGSCISSNNSTALYRTDINTTLFRFKNDLPDITSIITYSVNSCIANGMRVRVYNI